MSVIFEPWIGSLYNGKNRFGLRLLVLGESHYGAESETRPTITTEVVRWLAQDKRHAFFTKVSKVLLGIDKNTGLSSEERADIWEHVAFYNYIQGFVSTNPRVRPTPQMWEDAKEPFNETIRRLSPRLILVLGKELRKQLPENIDNIEICLIQHPSTGFKYEDWNPVFAEALHRAQSAN